MNKLFKTLVFDKEFSLSVLDTTDMVNEAIRIHNLTPTAAAALGRTMTVCTYMSSGLKSTGDKLYVTIAGDGPIGKITVCGNGELKMRGSVDNPSVNLPLKSNGKLDVGGAVGKGRLTVVKSMGLKEPYTGSAELITGEIAEDFTAYYAYSEQQPTAIALGVKIGTDGKCVGAGGVILAALPFATEKSIVKAEKVMENFSDISSKIETIGVEGVIKTFFDGEIDFFVNGRNLGELLGFDSDDVIFSRAAADFGKEAVVAFDFDFFGSEAADHIKEKFCVENDGAVFDDSGGHISGDAKLHVIAAEGEAVVLRNNEDAFHCRVGGLCGNGAGYVIERFGKFLAAARKFHKNLLRKKERIVLFSNNSRGCGKC